MLKCCKFLDWEGEGTYLFENPNNLIPFFLQNLPLTDSVILEIYQIIALLRMTTLREIEMLNM